MSRTVASVVLARRFGSCARKTVALVLADHADGDEWATTVGQKRTAAEAELSVRQVGRVLTEFEAEGLIKRERRHRKSGSRTSDRVILNEAAIKALPDAMSSSPEDTESHRPQDTASSSQPDVESTNQPATESGSDPLTTGHSPRRLPDTQSEPTGHTVAPYEPSGEPSVEPSSLRSDYRDLIFEAIVEACFGKPYVPGETKLTSRERGMVARAAKELKAVDATPDEIHRRASHFIPWVGQRPTPDNLVTHWNRLDAPQQKATPDQMRRLQREQDRFRQRDEIRRGGDQ